MLNACCRSGSKWGYDCHLMPFSTKSPSQTQTTAHSENSIQSLKQELLDESSEKGQCRMFDLSSILPSHFDLGFWIPPVMS